ncbi:DNA-binding SARP family transcriptional activator [Herbihabitans rhizosphaerae]|uniref:DNA-binding SARP family transcriptional activator n=1 Tax=Herbihabitans rhizosphaerae TaxID=1872711 RepID=A0A4Q7KLI4_9PSEU|nr:AfsR/SARP family transcriptional regulator [Herbihabitans rhizosphaerae]RZS36411.1 DNA-binding SARP family transcriptional activator [Herbihabitans rhizosphaerae]
MLFALLGPLRIRSGGVDVEIGADKPRAVLTVLLSAANTWVPTEAIIDAVWSRERPPSVRENLKTYVWMLRGKLPGRIEGRPGAYRILVADRELDTWQFEQSYFAARQLLASAQHAAASGRLADALRMWRGEPFTPIDTEPARAEADRLIELRWQVREALADSLLAAGRAAEAIKELRVMLAEDSLRELIWYRLLVALDLDGQRSEALASYHRARRALRIELGVEPGPELRGVYERLLTSGGRVPALTG